MATDSIIAINMALQRALGLGSLTQVRSVTLRLHAGELPLITVERLLLPGQAGAPVDDIATAVHVYRLQPVEEPPEGLGK